MWYADLHEQTSLPTSTVTDNDQLATDLRHLRNPSISRLKGIEKAQEKLTSEGRVSDRMGGRRSRSR